MSDQSAQKQFSDFPAQVCAETGAKGCVVIVVDEQGIHGMAAHNMTHFDTNQALSLGIHMNLSQHDEFVLAGAAGAQAQAVAQQLAKGGEA